MSAHDASWVLMMNQDYSLCFRLLSFPTRLEQSGKIMEPVSFFSFWSPFYSNSPSLSQVSVLSTEWEEELEVLDEEDRDVETISGDHQIVPKEHLTQEVDEIVKTEDDDSSLDDVIDLKTLTNRYKIKLQCDLPIYQVEDFVVRTAFHFIKRRQPVWVL